MGGLFVKTVLRPVLGGVALACIGAAMSSMANTGGDAVISPEGQAQRIEHFFKDYKNSNYPSPSQNDLVDLFINDDFDGIRTPIYGDLSHAAHPAPGVVIGSLYAGHVNAILGAMAVRPGLIVFASKKLDGKNSFPGWTKDANGVIPAQYAILLADYIQYMASNGIVVNVLGIDNERQYNEGNITPSRHTDVVDQLRLLAVSRGFPMPLIIGPDDYGPNKNSWMSTLMSSGWGDRLDLYGTHYYPAYRPLSGLQSDLALAGNRPKWHTELHWAGVAGQDELAVAEQSIVTMWDCLDSGMNGMMWWAYSRTGLRGNLMREFSVPLRGSRPVAMDDIDGPSTAILGRLQTRAFRLGNQITVYAINLSPINVYTDYGFNLDTGAIGGTVSYRQWTDISPVEGVAGTAALAGPGGFRLTLPARSLTKFTVPYVPSGPDARYALDGDALDASGNGNHGTPVNATNFIAGRIGAQALQFNGSNGYVQIPRVVGAATNFTITFWMKTTNGTGTGNQWYDGNGLVDGKMAGTTTDFGVTLLNGKIGFGVGNPDTTLQSTATVTNGQWRHVAVTRNAFDGELAIYLDGALNSVTNGPKGTRTAPTNLRLGSLLTGAAGKFYNGALDDVRLYNGLLGPADIAQLAAAPLPNTAPVLAAISNRVLIAGQTLNITNAATDAEVPPQGLTWSLTPVISGLAINTNTGAINWRPTLAQSPTTNTLQVIVADNGTPSLSDTQQFQVTVLRPVAPQLSAPQVSAGNFGLTISGDAGPDYTVLGSTNLSDWMPLLTTNPAALPFTLQLAVSNNIPQQFYRVQLGP